MNSNVKTVKLNLRTYINPDDPSQSRAQLTSMSTPRSSSSSVSAPIPIEPSTSSTTRSQHKGPSVQHGHQLDKQPPEKAIPNIKYRVESALLSILDAPDHDSNAFMEVMMRKHENSLRSVAAETHNNHTLTIMDLQTRYNNLQKERDALAVENEKLKMSKDIMSQELSELRETLLKTRLECKQLEQSVSDLEELVRQQEEVHYLELERIRRGNNSSKQPPRAVPMQDKEVIKNAERPLSYKRQMTKLEKPADSEYKAPTNTINSTRKKLVPSSSLSSEESSTVGGIPTASVNLYQSKNDTTTSNSQKDVIEEKRKSSITTTVMTSQPLPSTKHHPVASQQLIEQRLAHALQAQAEAEERLLRREEILRDLSEKNRQLQQHLRKHK